ncbi:MAG TPA: cation diffusion facilitator family transporter [Candidatus Izemoplasmatales bacterium]|nr:cation diffusion facilitator family transporter [Candidatus Izemoplasmatales bacterium]
MEQLENRNETEKRIIVRVSGGTMAVNGFLAAMKIIVGWLGNSTALLSDAVNSLSDVATGLAVMIFGKLSRKEHDTDHQYGHEKYESMVSVFLGVALLVTALEIARAAVGSMIGFLFQGVPIAPPTWLALGGAGLTILIKETLFHLTRKAAKKANSSALAAMALDHRSDVFAASGVLLGIGGALLGWTILEPIASLFIAALIVKLGVEIIRTGFNQVVDKAADPAVVTEITAICADHPGVLHVDDLKTRVFGTRLFVDLEIAVDPKLTVGQAHHIAHLLHDDIEERIPNVKHCMIHVNPLRTKEKD